MAKRERRQAERKLRNTKLTIFMDLYRQAKYKVSKLVHTAKCQFYTKRIALASSSKELHQIVNALSNRHPLIILPAIYPSADLPSIFIKHSTNNVEKFRANKSKTKHTNIKIRRRRKRCNELKFDFKHIEMHTHATAFLKGCQKINNTAKPSTYVQ